MNIIVTMIAPSQGGAGDYLLEVKNQFDEFRLISPVNPNYSNELMVELFLNNQIKFNDITLKNEHIINKFLLDGCNVKIPTIDDLKNAFKVVDSYVLSSN